MILQYAVTQHTHYAVFAEIVFNCKVLNDLLTPSNITIYLFWREQKHRSSVFPSQMASMEFVGNGERFWFLRIWFFSTRVSSTVHAHDMESFRSVLLLYNNLSNYILLDFCRLLLMHFA